MATPEFKVGDFVDSIRGPKQSKFHGIIIKVDGAHIHVMWLKSSETRDFNKIDTYAVAYHRGYTTIEIMSALVICEVTNPSTYHPETNPWGAKFGLSD